MASPSKAEEIETKVAKEAERLRKTAADIGAMQEGNLAGIMLLENIARDFKQRTPFPMYAYTSKGPYLLRESACDHVVKSGAKVLFKNRLGRQIEKMLICEDIDTCKREHSLRAKLARYLWTVLVTCGLLSALLGAKIGFALERLFPNK